MDGELTTNISSNVLQLQQFHRNANIQDYQQSVSSNQLNLQDLQERSQKAKRSIGKRILNRLDEMVRRMKTNMKALKTIRRSQHKLIRRQKLMNISKKMAYIFLAKFCEKKKKGNKKSKTQNKNCLKSLKQTQNQQLNRAEQQLNLNQLPLPQHQKFCQSGKLNQLFFAMNETLVSNINKGFAQNNQILTKMNENLSQIKEIFLRKHHKIQKPNKKKRLLNKADIAKSHSENSPKEVENKDLSKKSSSNENLSLPIVIEQAEPTNKKRALMIMVQLNPFTNSVRVQFHEQLIVPNAQQDSNRSSGRGSSGNNGQQQDASQLSFEQFSQPQTYPQTNTVFYEEISLSAQPIQQIKQQNILQAISQAILPYISGGQFVNKVALGEGRFRQAFENIQGRRSAFTRVQAEREMSSSEQQKLEESERKQEKDQEKEGNQE